MKQIPDFLRRFPQLLYAAAVILFVWYLANGVIEISQNSATYGATEGLENLTKSRYLFEAFREAIYIASSGAMIHILIAIFDKVKGHD